MIHKAIIVSDYLTSQCIVLCLSGTGDELEEGEIPEISVDAPAAVRSVVAKTMISAGLHTVTRHRCNICNVSAMSQTGLEDHYKCESLGHRQLIFRYAFPPIVAK